MNKTSVGSLIPSFAQKLATLNIADLGLTGYAHEYLQLLLNQRIYYLNIYSHVIDTALQHVTQRREDLVFVDYGAGNGLLGIFAKHCGFKTVFLVDRSETFVQAAIKLSKALNLRIDGFVAGDCEDLADFVSTRQTPGVVAGTDVIEHIYNLDVFFNCLKRMNDRMVTVFTTASVIDNPIKNHTLKKLQYADEYKGSNATHASTGDEYAGLPFFQTRKKMIKKEFFLDDDLLERLAAATRGMKKEDIIEAVKAHAKDGRFPALVDHATNTCDPVTGSWTERLLTIDEYQAIYQKAGFLLFVRNGFYNEWQGGFKGFLMKIANLVVSRTGSAGRIVAPFITLIGKEK